MSGAATDAGVRPGDVLAGKYRVERVLGQGGMGVVVAAHHIQLDEKVALKFLLPHALTNPESVARFAQEARAAVKIKSEHVARVTDVGQLENGSPYMVMEYLDGGDLAGWLRQRGQLPVEIAVDFILQTCEAVADAHALGIVHRDLKPANLFCIQRTDGQLAIKVLDFGISKVTTVGAQGNDMTKTSALMGTPFYMSPEQMRMSKGVDARSDIWSLGVILFELLAGQPPFNGESVTDLAIKVATQPTPRLLDFRADVPPALEEAIATCLAKDRAMRFQNVGDLAMALKDFGPRNARISVERVLGTLRQAGLTGAALPLLSNSPPASPVAPAVTAPGGPPQTGASWGQTGSGTKGSKKTTLAVVVAGAVVAVAVGGAVMLRKPAATGASTASTAAAIAPSTPAAIATPPSLTTTPSAAANPPPTPSVAELSLPTLSPAATATNERSVPRTTTAAPPQAPPKPTAAAPQPSGAASKKPNCNPPYVIDSAGDRQYKPECL